MTTTVMNNVVGSGGKRILHFVNLQGMSILRQLQLEEAILRHTNLNM